MPSTVAGMTKSELNETYSGDGGAHRLFKLREGDYRIIYQVLRKENLIIIHAIGHRRDIYK